MVSVIITTYKRPPEILERAMQSVLSQTCPDWELLVVDDSPPDYAQRPDVESAVRQYEPYGVRYLPHERNLGANAARNTGLAAAKGDFVAYLDDDDEWLPEKLEKQLEAMEKYGADTALIYCGRMVHNDTDGSTHEAKTTFLDGEVFDRLMVSNFIGSTSYPLLRTAALREIGGFDLDLPASQDFDVWLRIAQKHKVGFVREPLAKYHIHDGETITGNPKKKLDAALKINAKHAEYLASHPAAQWKRHMMTAKYYGADGQISKMLSSWCRGAALRPGAVGENFKHLRYAVSNAAKRGKR